MRHVPAQSRHDSGVCACLVESGLYLSILVISWVWSLSFLHLLLLFLLLLFLNALAFIFSVTRSFSLPEFSFFPLGHVLSPCSHGQCSAVVLRRSA